MKRTLRIFSILTCITMMLLCIPFEAFAIDYYAVYVSGVQITSNNYEDPLKNGTVSFDYETKTLTLNNASITSTTNNGQVVGISCENFTLNLKLIGDNVIDLSKMSGGMVSMGIDAYKDLHIIGDGNLTVKAPANGTLGNYGISAEYDIYLENTGSLYFEAGSVGGGSKYRSAGVRSYEDHIYVNGPKLIEALGYSGSFYSVPIVQGDYDYSYYGNEIPERGDTPIDELSSDNLFRYMYIRMEQNTPSNVIVGGTMVSKKNCDDVLGDGTVSYDYDTQSLILNSASINKSTAVSTFDGEDLVPYDVNIYSEKDLTIKLCGHNVLTAEKGESNYNTNILCEGDLTFTGGGSLAATATSAKWSGCVYAIKNVNFNTLGSINFVGADPDPVFTAVGVYAGGQVTFAAPAKGMSVDIRAPGGALLMGNIQSDLVDDGCDVWAAVGMEDEFELLEVFDASNYQNYCKLSITGEAAVVLGDCNDDGKVDMKDVLFLRKFIAQLPTYINEIAADINGDNALDMKDVLVLRKTIAGLI